MIISTKCNCCIHESVCGFKQEYLAACEAIRKVTYAVGNGIAFVKDSGIDIGIKCPHMLTQSAARRMENEQR